MNRRESVGRLTARSQSASGPPSQQMVSVAVLPPRLVGGMAPPTRIAAADCFNWDESINWQHNDPINDNEEFSKKKGFFRKAGITTQRKKLNPDLPPFILRQVPYDTWRKHYAKDKDGNFRGTHTPAMDCLLKPDDVQKWRLGAPVTKGDLWTRGSEALPVYAEVQGTAAVPEYEHDYDGPLRTEPYHDVTGGHHDGMTLDADDDRLASHLERNSSRTSQPFERIPSTSSHISQSTGQLPNSSAPVQVEERRPSRPYQPFHRVSGSSPPTQSNGNAGAGQIIADDKTAQQIIEEAKAKGKEGYKMGWKARVKKGAEIAMMGNS